MTIQQMMLNLVSSGTVNIAAHTYTRTRVDPLPSTASYTLNNTGIASQISDASGNIAGEWLTTGLPGNFESRATVLSGTLTAGTTGTWQDLGTSRSWSKTQSGVGTSTVVILIEIRDLATLAVIGSANITLTGTVTP